MQTPILNFVMKEQHSYSIRDLSFKFKSTLTLQSNYLLEDVIKRLLRSFLKRIEYIYI